MKTLTIDRAQWKRTGKNAYIDSNGCCILGHYFRSVGASDNHLQRYNCGAFRNDWFSNYKNGMKAVQINDSDLPDAEAEQQLTELFKTNDIDLQFIGERQ